MEILTMKTKIFLISALTVGLGLGAASCDSYLDINQDPNSPTDENVTTSMVMPGAEIAVAVHYGNYLRIVGGYFAQYYAQQFGTSNYLDYSRFNISASHSSRTYTELYQKALNNLKNVSDRATAQGDMGTVLAATTLRAFVFQVLVDCYGSVPYTEALNPEILAPHYDEGLTVYQGILAELDAALAQTDAAASVCTNFLFPNESADSWIKFAKALKLKILMRMSDVQDVQGQLSALVSEGDFPTTDIAWVNCWSDEAEKRSPFYTEEFQPGVQQNLVANLAQGNYEGSIGGATYTQTQVYNGDYWCRPNVTYDEPVSLISVAETEFFLAEYYARYGSESDAAAHYAAAVEASFASEGVSGANEYLARNPYDNANYRQCIGVAKWIALAGSNGFEAWCEVRRLGYPAFGTAQGSDFYNNTDESFDTSSYVAGTLYTPFQVFGQVGANQLLARFPYPEDSSSRNSNVPDFPGYTVPVFWAE